MLKKLTTIGSSRGLILDKTLLGLLGLEDAEQVSLRVEGHRLIVEAPNAFDEIRARIPAEQDDATVDAIIDDAVKRERKRSPVSHPQRRRAG